MYILMFFLLVTAVAWHPVHEGMFASGGSDGSLLFWHAGWALHPFSSHNQKKIIVV